MANPNMPPDSAVDTLTFPFSTGYPLSQPSPPTAPIVRAAEEGFHANLLATERGLRDRHDNANRVEYRQVERDQIQDYPERHLEAWSAEINHRLQNVQARENNASQPEVALAQRETLLVQTQNELTAYHQNTHAWGQQMAHYYQERHAAQLNLDAEYVRVTNVLNRRMERYRLREDELSQNIGIARERIIAVQDELNDRIGRLHEAEEAAGLPHYDNQWLGLSLPGLPLPPLPVQQRPIP